MDKVSLEYKPTQDGHYDWKVYVNGKFYASGKTKGDAGNIIDEYLTDNPNAIRI